MAPEMILCRPFERYDRKVDIWQFGLLVLEMLEGKIPYENEEQVIGMPEPRVKNVMRWSVGVRDFVAKCLVKDPEQRTTARSLLGHKWLIDAESHAEDCFNAIEKWKYAQ